MLISKYLIFYFHLDPKFGYVKKLSMLSPTRDNKARYFTFTVQLENVSLRKSINWYQKYSPKNRAVKYKIYMNVENELLVEGQTTLKKLERNFEKISTLSRCSNECQTNDMVNVIWLIFILTETEHIQKDGKILKLQQWQIKVIQ